MGQLGHADDVGRGELNVVVQLNPDVLAAVEEPLGCTATAAGYQGILPDGAQIGLPV